MSAESAPAEQLSYEQAFAELETIIHRLENEQPTLEEALQLYERGQALVQRCAALLDQAELRVRQLSGNDIEIEEDAEG
ncbi:MAG: exodeoxyribonuclease VII small subunit [Chloroflexota bacterium]|nr:MAG: exodeoxyribonuclease 7 small subunit [Bellilinea sp.]